MSFGVQNIVVLVFVDDHDEDDDDGDDDEDDDQISISRFHSRSGWKINWKLFVQGTVAIG